MILPILNDDNGMFERKHSPILTRFPSDILVRILKKNQILFFFVFNKIKINRSYFDDDSNSNHRL